MSSDRIRRVVRSTDRTAISSGHIANIPGNAYAKHESDNPLVAGLMRRFHSAVIERVRQTEGTSLLDVGCGEGHSTAAISVGSGIEAVACDLELPVLQTAANVNPGFHYSAASVYELPYADRSFDVVLGTEILEHLDDPPGALREIHRVSRRWAILTVPLEPWWRVANLARGAYVRRLGNTPGHVQHWTGRGFERLLADHFDAVIVDRVALWSVALCRK